MNNAKENPRELLLIHLYETYAKKVYAIAYSILKNKGQAEDVVHDTFISLMPYLEQLEGAADGQKKGLITRITKNEAINKYRKNQRESRFYDRSGESGHEMQKRAIVPGIQGVEERYFIRSIMERLDEKSQEIIMYRCFYELNYKEIADVLEITEEAAMKRFERAKRQIQKMNGDE